MRTGPHDYGPREWGVFFLTPHAGWVSYATHERTYRAAREIFAGDRTDFQRILVVVAHKPRATPRVTSYQHAQSTRQSWHHNTFLITTLSLSTGPSRHRKQPAVYILINTPSLLVLIFLPHLSRATTARSDAFCR